MIVDDVVDRLAALSLFDAVPRPQIEWLAARGEIRTYPSGMLLREAGGAIDEMLILFAQLGRDRPGDGSLPGP